MRIVSLVPHATELLFALGLGDDTYHGVASSLQAKRDLLCEGLTAAGLTGVEMGIVRAVADLVVAGE